jgi:hypothetical protein
MQSSLIGKIEKARRYAQEPSRITFHEMRVSFRGENDVHEVNYHEGTWRCTCDFFASWGRCCHTMAMEKILIDMLPKGTEPMVDQPNLARV